MARLSSAGLMFMLEDGARTDYTGSAISKAKPAVITMTDTTGIAEGDHVVVAGTGFKSVDDRVFKVGTVTGTTFQLLGSDTSAEAGAAAATFDIQEVALEETCVATIQRQPGTPATIDVTTLCDTARRKVSGLPDSGSLTLDGYYDSEDPGYLRLVAAAADPNQLRVMGMIPSDGSEILWIGRITGIGESAGVDQAVTFSGTGLVDGPVTYVAPPA